MGQSTSSNPKNLHQHPHTPILKVGVSNLYYDESASKTYNNVNDPNKNNNNKRRISIPGANRAVEGGYYFKPHLESLLTTNNIIEAESSLRYVLPVSMKAHKKLTFILKPSNKQLAANKPVTNITTNVLTPTYILEEYEFNVIYIIFILVKKNLILKCNKIKK